MSARRVAITGIGILCGYGRGGEALWAGLSSGRSAIGEHRARLGRRDWLAYPMAALRDDPAGLARAFPNREFVRDNHLGEDPDFIALADCVAQALEDAGLGDGKRDHDVGLIVTHESPGLAPHVQSFFRWGRMAKAWWRSRSKFSPPDFLYEQQSESVYRLHSFLYLHYLSALFHLHGFTLYNNNACASGAFSLAVAADRIRSGDSDAVVVVGGDIPEDGTKYRWFRDLGLYSARGQCRPFRADRDGMVLGSGAAALVLEDLDLARRAGRNVYAEWLGAGFTSDGWKVTFPDVVGRRYRDAIARALKVAQVEPGDLSLLVPHGVGSGLYDRFEASCLGDVLGDSGAPWPPMMLLKQALGHTLGGCALVETVAALLAMRQGRIPEAARCVEPDPALSIGPPRPGPLLADGLILKCTNGFGGQNGAMVLRAMPA
ncbi:MAG TPA: beta-ketoacyl synthase N-terminal-like domain-containing protein [Candidatus Polarisedimenticolia bacterium]|nr:beta-ketoacyl synthase N-terminal-like domain-containing protein [Candidatus Polarisedimenticolia bacterium]